MYKRFWLNNTIIGDKIIIDGEEHNHISNVLRLKIRDTIIVTCGDEYDYICEIESISKKSTSCIVISKQINRHNPKKQIDVFQALIKNDKMSLLTQKLNEVGITNLILFETKNQTVKPSDNKRDKLQKISDQSAKQCKRSKSMVISDVLTFKSMLSKLSYYDIIIFANETEDSVYLNSLISNINKSDRVAIIIGSEGGFSENEIHDIINNNGISVSLGSRILRAETASITLGSFVSYIMNN